MKKLAFIFATLAIVTFSSVNVYAYNQNSGFHKGPEAYADGKAHSSISYKLKSASAPITGKKTGVIFSSLGHLRDTVCVGDNNRKLVIYLMEEDLANDNDTIKLYTGTFEGLQVTRIDLVGYSTPSMSNEYIESENDDTAELFIAQIVGESDRDYSSTHSNGELYYFDIRLD